MVLRLLPALGLALGLALTACGDNDPLSDAAPRLVIVSPDNGAILPLPASTLTFRVENAPATSYTLAVGSAVPTFVEDHIEVDAEISVPLALLSGVNTVTLDVTGEGDTSDRATLVVIHELANAPRFTITAPSDGATTFGPTRLEGHLASSHPIVEATVGINAATPTLLAVTAVPGGYTFTLDLDLPLGASTVALAARDDRDQTAQASLHLTRVRDEEAPVAAISFPRAGEAVRTRTVLVRGTVADNAGAATVAITSNGVTVPATVGGDGTFTATVALVPAMNELSILATDAAGNARTVAHAVYYGTRLASGGAHGGALRDGQLYTWGRNNLGQTGLDYVSHESRTAYCERTLTTPRDIALCKATTITLLDAVCLDPGFATPTPADSPEAATCRATNRAYRDTVCDAAGAAAPTNCKTSNTVNLATLCDTTYGASTPASSACEARFVCDGAYPSGPDRASCTAMASSVPSVFPSPAAPYTPVAVNAFSPVASPAAPTGTGITFAALGVTFTSIAFNQNASSALDAEGRVWSWGDNGSGMLCLGDVLERKLPHRVSEFGAAGTTAIALSRGYDHVLILRSDGSVWGCGLNGVGQLGDGTTTLRALPTRVQGLPASVIQVFASSQASYALTADGKVYAWGRNQYGNLGNGTASTTAAPVPVMVAGLPDVTMIGGGRDHVLVVTGAGTVYGWGLNASHQINGDVGNVLAPVQIAGVTDARQVFGNGNQGFYENAQGQLLGWGQNGSGNLGIPEDEDQPAPTMPVFGLSAVLDVGIGALQGFAMRGNQVFAWGWSFHGSLGAGASAIHTWPYRTPVLVQLP